MTAAPEFRAGQSGDLAAVCALLRAAGLPFEDLREEAMPEFIVLHGADGLIAAGGVERHGDDGLLRSVVVTEAARGQGLGQMIVAALERRAISKGLNALYLLTTTAADFFAERGYERIERDSAPTDIARSAEFAALCPASAACLRKRLA